MRIDRRCDEGITKTVTDQFTGLIVDHPDLTYREAISALVLTIGNVVLNVPWPDDRKTAIRWAIEEVEFTMQDALAKLRENPEPSNRQH